MVIILVQLDTASSDHTHLRILDKDQSIAKYSRARVYSQDYAFVIYRSFHSSKYRLEIDLTIPLDLRR